MLGAWFLLLISCFIHGSNGANIFETEGIVPVVKFGTKSYYFSDNHMATFYQANQICNELGMRLCTIPSQEVNNFLYQTINTANKVVRYWTSGTNLVDTKNWVWISTAQPVLYTNWIVGQPDPTAEYCLEVQLHKNIDLAWNNLDCNVPLNFICESQDATLNSWPSVFTDPSVSPNYPIFNYNNNVYYMGNKVPLPYLDADRFCKMIGMELVSIESEEENYQIYKYIRDTVAGVTFWSGGTRLVDGINWYWLPSGRKVVYTSWLKGTPDTKVEHCIQLQFLKDIGLFWNDLTCAVAQNFICKAPTKKIATCPTVYGSLQSTLPNPIVPVVPVFYLGKETVSQNDAVKKCEALGLKLVSIQTKCKQEAVNKFIGDSAYADWIWTSGNRVEDKKTWRWLSGEVFTVLFWNNGEPNNASGNEECMAVKKLGDISVWNDTPCVSLHYYLCETIPDQNNCQNIGQNICKNSCNQPSVFNVFIENQPKSLY